MCTQNILFMFRTGDAPLRKLALKHFVSGARTAGRMSPILCTLYIPYTWLPATVWEDEVASGLSLQQHLDFMQVPWIPVGLTHIFRSAAIGWCLTTTVDICTAGFGLKREEAGEVW